MANDLYNANFSTHQSLLNPQPVTLTAAATVAPTTFLTMLSGTVSVSTITPPLTGTHVLALCATVTTLATVTTGNIALATTLVANRPCMLTYNPVTAKYYPSYT